MRHSSRCRNGSTSGRNRRSRPRPARRWTGPPLGNRRNRGRRREFHRLRNGRRRRREQHRCSAAGAAPRRPRQARRQAPPAAGGSRAQQGAGANRPVQAWQNSPVLASPSGPSPAAVAEASSRVTTTRPSAVVRTRERASLDALMRRADRKRVVLAPRVRPRGGDAGPGRPTPDRGRRAPRSLRLRPGLGSARGLGAVPICHGAPQPGDDAPAPPAHHGDDCALCPLCLALAAPAVLLARPVPPLPRIVLTRRAAPLPPARAPPALGRARDPLPHRTTPPGLIAPRHRQRRVSLLLLLASPGQEPLP